MGLTVGRDVDGAQEGVAAGDSVLTDGVMLGLADGCDDGCEVG